MVAGPVYFCAAAVDMEGMFAFSFDRCDSQITPKEPDPQDGNHLRTIVQGSCLLHFHNAVQPRERLPSIHRTAKEKPALSISNYLEGATFSGNEVQGCLPLIVTDSMVCVVCGMLLLETGKVDVDVHFVSHPGHSLLVF
jgi:hypothetical protein